MRSNSFQKKAVRVLVLFLAIGAVPLRAEGGPAGDKSLERFRRDILSLWSSPCRWSGKDFLRLGVLAGAAAGLTLVDDDLQGRILESRGTVSRDLSPLVRPFGQGGGIAMLIGALYAAGELGGRPDLKTTARLSLESWLGAGSIVLAAKILIGRARPSTGLASDVYRPFSLKNAFFSMPSGDAASAFAVASVLAGRSASPWIDALCFSLAGLVAFYRVHDGKHWVSDVVVGSALGYAVGRKILALNRRPGGAGLRVLAAPSGISLIFSY